MNGLRVLCGSGSTEANLKRKNKKTFDFKRIKL